MRDLVDILAAFERMAPRDAGVLASVVHASGSTYRRIGGRLLVLPDDEVIGLISGGCLEGDLLAHAAEVLEESEGEGDAAPRLVRYDASDDDDIVWGLGLGCAGVVEVLLEPVGPGRPGPLAWLAAWRRARATGVIATALDPDRLGRRWALHPDDRVEGAPGDEVLAALHRARRSGRSRRIATREGDLSVEVVRPPLRLVVFGAGPDAAPVARLALDLGWEVEIVDHRPARARAARFPGARMHLAPVKDAVAQVGVDRDTYTLVMTHHYLDDRALLSDLLPTPTPYVGVLGPRQRTEDLLADLERLGIDVSAGQRRRLHGPAGLDIGGEGPEEIALSVLAEVMAVAEERSGGWLRDRKGPLHPPEEA